jgi:hypothetical protein
MKKKVFAGVAFVIATSLAGIAHAEQGAGDFGGDGPRAGAGKFIRQMDTNGDGNVTKAEFAAGSAARADAIFKKLDADGNGQVSKAEFEAGAPSGGGVFGRFDRNGDGVINKADRGVGQAGKRHHASQDGGPSPETGCGDATPMQAPEGKFGNGQAD